MNRRSVARTVVGCLTVIAAAAVVSQAGPLDPPPGPVSSTHKTLTEIEPRTPVETLSDSATSLFAITEAGSYYLTDHILGVSGKNGIAIEADNVHLDLNGFTLQGVSGSLSGIAVSGTNRSNISIRNGTVTGWSGHGLDIVLARQSSVDEITASSNGVNGIEVGDHCVVKHSIARSNGDHGVETGLHCTLTLCIANGNTSDGIILRTGGSAYESTATENGADGFCTGFGVLLSECVATDNADDGIQVPAGSTVNGCTLRSNGGFGVNASDCLIRGNCATENGLGNINGPLSSSIDNHTS